MFAVVNIMITINRVGANVNVNYSFKNNASQILKSSKILKRKKKHGKKLSNRSMCLSGFNIICDRSIDIYNLYMLCGMKRSSFDIYIISYDRY